MHLDWEFGLKSPVYYSLLPGSTIEQFKLHPVVIFNFHPCLIFASKRVVVLTDPFGLFQFDPVRFR
jgi:hypothetical protein